MIPVVEKGNLTSQWFVWYFRETPKGILRGWSNILNFNLQYFSVSLLLKTLFSPWRGIKWSYSQGFNPLQYLETVFSNLITRILGALVRLFIIAFGLVTELIFFLAGLTVLLTWLLLPLFIFLGLFFGLLILQGISGWAVFSLTLGIICWQSSLFSELKLKRPRLRVNLEQALLNPLDYDLTEFLDFSAGQTLRDAKKLCQEKTLGPVNSSVLFYSLIRDNQGVVPFVFFRLLLNQKSLKAVLEKNLQILKEGIESDFPGLILEAAKISQKNKDERISQGSLLIAIARNNSLFKKVLVETDLKVEDVENLVWWWSRAKQKIRESKRFWEYKNLVKRGSIGREFASSYTYTLDQFGKDWLKILVAKGFEEIIGHQPEIEQIERLLARSEFNNVLLVGEPGSGRGAVLEALAQRIIFGESLPELNYQRVVELDLPLLVSQCKTGAEINAALEHIFSEVVLAKNVILIVQDLQNFITTSNDNENPSVDISGSLLGYLRTPGLKLIAVTTPEGLHRTVELSQLNAFLEKVEIAPVSKQDTIMLLELFVPFWEAKYKKFVSYQAIRELVEKSEKYLPSLPFPKKATDLMGELMVFVSQEKTPIVLPEHVDQLISQKSKIPIGQLSSKEKDALLNLESLLHQRIINQEEAVKEVASATRRARSGITVRKGPMGTFLFLGPTGVGKTETAKALAAIYFGSEERIIRLDLSEYQTSQDVKRLIGSLNEESYFVTQVRENPFSLVLLDEIEKAHPNIHNLFLQILDEGVMTDGLGRKISFTNTMIIATSNAGYQVILDAISQNLDMSIIKQKLLDYIFQQAIFRPEFINRFDAVVVFKSLTKENLLNIAELLMQSLKKNLSEKGVELVITAELKEKIVELGYDPVFGARQMRRVIQDKVENVIATALLTGELKRGDRIEITVPDFILKKR
jgi:ATP-dependent Clp protease ATP-binding subunit ClpC